MNANSNWEMTFKKSTNTDQTPDNEGALQKQTHSNIKEMLASSGNPRALLAVLIKF